MKARESCIPRSSTIKRPALRAIAACVHNLSQELFAPGKPVGAAKVMQDAKPCSSNRRRWLANP